MYHTNKVYINDTKYLCLSYETLAFTLIISISLFSSWIASFAVTDLKKFRIPYLLLVWLLLFLSLPFKEKTPLVPWDINLLSLMKQRKMKRSLYRTFCRNLGKMKVTRQGHLLATTDHVHPMVAPYC